MPKRSAFASSVRGQARLVDTDSNIPDFLRCRKAPDNVSKNELSQQSVLHQAQPTKAKCAETGNYDRVSKRIRTSSMQMPTCEENEKYASSKEQISIKQDLAPSTTQNKKKDGANGSEGHSVPCKKSGDIIQGSSSTEGHDLHEHSLQYVLSCFQGAGPGAIVGREEERKGLHAHF
jgi:hypothetical protein